MAPKRILSIAVCLALFFSLIWPAESPSQVFLAFETVAKGEISHYSLDDPKFIGAEMAIGDPSTWEWFWRQHTRGGSPAPPLPFIDFRRETILAVLLGIQTSGGGPAIEIRAVEDISDLPSISAKARYSRSLKIHVRENRTPGPLEVITNPFHIVKVNRTRLSAVFHRQPLESSGSCGTNADCENSAYCLNGPGDCLGFGRCRPMPQACIQVYDPVCGCDLKTYGNECEAARNRVSILHSGPCR
jgi:hypothetical protein